MTAEPPVEVEAVDETDFDFIEEDPMVVPEVSFRRAYVRDEPRPVTMMDLLDAFEEAKKEAENRRKKVDAAMAKGTGKGAAQAAGEADKIEVVDEASGEVLQPGTAIE